MKLYKGFLHFLITLVSTFAFLTGWITLAHSLKPIQPVKQEALAPLEPLPPVGLVKNSPSSNGLKIFSPAPRVRSRSMFVTRGS
ncbi:MAG: hypothetical protein PVJ21_10225 [Anaerolineales bacterium]